MGHVTWPRLFQRHCIRRLGLAMIHPHTKFEVSMFMNYEHMRGNAKCRNWGGFGGMRNGGGGSGHPRSPAMSPFDRVHTTSYLTLMKTMRLPCTVFELQQVIYRKSMILTYPTCIWCPYWGWPCSSFAETFGIRKLEPQGYCVALLAWSNV